jgi:hypothetical protein
VLSLGTGEPSNQTSGNVSPTDLLKEDSRRIWKYGAIPRIRDLLLEKMRDRNIRQFFRNHPKYHRLNIEFDGAEPRLDDTKNIPELKSKVREDTSQSNEIDHIVRRLISSLFYFELEYLPERTQGKYVAAGVVFCTICRGDPDFTDLMQKLASCSASFLLDGRHVAAVADIISKLGQGENFKLRLELEVTGGFTIALKQGDSDPCDISGSPFSIDRLVSAQGLAASFGTADHGKRKRSWDSDMAPRKRRRTKFSMSSVQS